MSGQRDFRPAAVRPPGMPGQSGFTLIETLAAFILLALFLGVLLSSLGTAMRHTVWAEQQSLAAEWAQSKLDLVGIGEPIEEGSSRDRFDDTYRWEMQITEYDPPRDPPQLTSEQLAAGYQPMEYDPDALGLHLYRIDLAVLWGERDQERSLDFTTVRAYSPDQAVLFNPDASGADPAGQYGYGAGQRGGNAGGQQRPVRPGRATR